MPQIPTYGGPQVQKDALRPVYQNTPDVSSGLQAVARGMQQLGQGIETKLDRDAETEANRIDTEITAKWLEWDSEARRKYQGQNVGQYEVEARDWWKKTAGEYGNTTNPRVRERIGLALGRKQNQALGSVLGHVNAEKDRFADQQAEAAAQTSIEFGIDTGDMAGARQRVRQITAEQAARKGWTTEQVDVENQRRLGTMHLAYIDRVAQEDAEKARAYYEQNKAEIPGRTQAQVEKVLKGEGDNQFATQFAAQNATLPLAEQIAKAGEIKDPERREKTLLQIKNQQALVKVAQAEREAAASDEAWQLVGQGKRVPERTLQTMNGRERVQLQDYLRQRAEHAATKGNAPVKTDPVAHAALWEMATRDPEAFKKERLPAYAMKLAQGDLEQLFKMQQGMLNPKGEGDIVKWNNKVTARLELLGASTGKSTEVKRGQFRTAAQKEFEAYQRANGRAPSPEDEDKILNRLSLPGESGWFSDGEADTYAESVATGKKFVPKISREERAAIRNTFKSRGVENPTDEQIAEVFKRMKGL